MPALEEETYILRPKNHFNDVMHALNEQRKRQDKTVCDVILAVEGTVAVAHKAVLVACSYYFKQHFMEEKNAKANNQSLSKNQTNHYNKFLFSSSIGQSSTVCESPPTKRRKTVSESLPENTSPLSSPLSPHHTSTPPPQRLQRKQQPLGLRKHENSHKDVVSLPGIKAKALHQILDFMYSSIIHINKENIQDLLLVSCLLQVRPVMEACTKILSKEVKWRIAPLVKHSRDQESLSKQQSGEKKFSNTPSITSINNEKSEIRSVEKQNEKLLVETTTKFSNHLDKPEPVDGRDSDSPVVLDSNLDKSRDCVQNNFEKRLLENKANKENESSDNKPVQQSNENSGINAVTEAPVMVTEAIVKKPTETSQQKQESLKEKSQLNEAERNFFHSDDGKHEVLDLRQRLLSSTENDDDSLPINSINTNIVNSEKRRSTLKETSNISSPDPIKCPTDPTNTEPQKDEPIQPKKFNSHLFSHFCQDVSKLHSPSKPEILLSAPPAYELYPSECLQATPYLRKKNFDLKFLLEPPGLINANHNSEFVGVSRPNYINGITSTRTESSQIIGDLSKSHIDPYHALPFRLWPLFPESFPYFNPGFTPTLLNCAPSYMPPRNGINLEKLKAFQKFSTIPLQSPEAFASLNAGTIGSLPRPGSGGSPNNYMHPCKLKTTFNNEIGFRANSIESSHDSSPILLPRSSVAAATQFNPRNISEESPTSRRRQCVV